MAFVALRLLQNCKSQQYSRIYWSLMFYKYSFLRVVCNCFRSPNKMTWTCCMVQRWAQGDVVLLHDQWCPLLQQHTGDNVLTWWTYITVPGHWARWCGITTCSVLGTPHQWIGNQCGYLRATCYYFRPLSKVMWYYCMFSGGHTSPLNW